MRNQTIGGATRWAALAAVVLLAAGCEGDRNTFGYPTQSASGPEVYTPGIWVDPDGCEHWVMDDGAEGFMTPNVRPDGRPVCRGPAPAAPGIKGRIEFEPAVTVPQ